MLLVADENDVAIVEITECEYNNAVITFSDHIYRVYNEKKTSKTGTT